PQCMHCFRWGHPTSKCHTKRDTCDRCGGPHAVNHHNASARCCENRPDRLSSPCPHPPWCRNCGGAHYASDRTLCEFARHRNDGAWYKAQRP
ncbi:hypothetical protein K466DRAFT_442056, partial [Polyporus arcularius HHB13444]